MGLLDGQTQRAYYNVSDNYGKYQFVTLQNIIDAFTILYVGNNKIIQKAEDHIIRFHALRAIQELSYDVLRSFKSQEITVPNTLKMVLPQDYVNYTKVARVGTDGIERTLYPTGRTSNPFPIKQDGEPGSFSHNYDFGFTPRTVSITIPVEALITDGDYYTLYYKNASGADAQIHFRFDKDSTNLNQYTNPTGEGFVVGIDVDGTTPGGSALRLANAINEFGHHTATYSDAGTTATVTIVYKETMSSTPTETVRKANGSNGSGTGSIVVATSSSGTASGNDLQEENSSTTWTGYQSQTINDTFKQNDSTDVEIDMMGRRYGLDPQHAHTNGSFYIDSLRGMIHFGSALAGETIVLKYVSDGVGTDEEMVVHKFAEEAVYKWIAHGIVSTRSNIPEYIVQRFKKERFAETRKAKIRLSNIKMEEFTQVLKGISKQIK
tara:strand:+ start:8260 stop:9567 length:1308 start_codon:yes stop_codon:yes gene_type:complete